MNEANVDALVEPDNLPEMSIFDGVMLRQGGTQNLPAEAWADISTEEIRIYRFGQDQQIAIANPVALAVNQRGSHRIIDMEGVSHYIPAGWMQLSWKVKGQAPYFSF